MQVGKLRQSLVGTTLKKLFEKPETTTEKALQDQGFSKEMIDSFFRPFLGGIFLDSSLRTSSRMFDFVFKMFSKATHLYRPEAWEQLPTNLPPSCPQLRFA